jgi:tRNA pseudouridine55 synthase
VARRRRRTGREVNGILLLDKPRGMTSNQALQAVKRIYRAQKAGHTGSLDPLATGLLPVCLGEATKISGFLLDADKAYSARCRLGIRTDSADADGEIIATRPVVNISRERIEQALAKFMGDIQQIPPMHSAIKQNGTPLYKLAHQGIEVEREPRQVSIHEIRLVRWESEELDIYVHCSKGTYIRTLADDLGEELGCGAHITDLRRERVEPFSGESMVALQTLETLAQQGNEALDACLLPVEAALKQWPAVKLSTESAFYLRQGQAVFVPRVKGQGWVRLYENEEDFIGVGVIQDDGKVAPKRLMNMAN